MDKKTESLLYNLSKTIFEEKEWDPNGYEPDPKATKIEDLVQRAGQGVYRFLGDTIGLGKPQVQSFPNEVKTPNMILPPNHEASQGKLATPVPANVDPSYFDQGVNWIKTNPGLATAGAVGIPVALAGSYLAYKKLKDKNAKR